LTQVRGHIRVDAFQVIGVHLGLHSSWEKRAHLAATTNATSANGTGARWTEDIAQIAQTRGLKVSSHGIEERAAKSTSKIGALTVRCAG
jgi:hypothetical protein